MHSRDMTNVWLTANGDGDSPCGNHGEMLGGYDKNTLHAAEARIPNRMQVRKLHAFQIKHPRSIMGITWIYHIAYKEILNRANIPSMEQLQMQVTLRWAGRLAHVDDNKLPQ